MTSLPGEAVAACTCADRQLLRPGLRGNFGKLFLPQAIGLAFLLSVSGAGADNTSVPKLFWGSDPINGGETAMLYGDGLGPNASAEGWRLPDEPVTAPPTKEEPWSPTGAGTTLEVLQSSGECAKTVLPKDWSMGIFVVRLKNGASAAEPFFLNRPELWWWLGGENDRAYQGEELRVFGKNFGEKSRVWLVSESGQATELPMLKAEKYAVRCQIPKEITPGTYSLWLHNGFGGKAGFGKPLSVTVTARTPWPTTRFDVRSFGAKIGDMTADATWAIQNALKAAEKNGGGVVYLPGGVYRITGKLIMPAKTVLKGENRDTVTLFVPVVGSAEIDSVIAGDGDFAVEDLTIIASTARRMISCPLKPELTDSYNFAQSLALLSEADWGHNVHLRRICLRQERRGLGIGEVPNRPHGWAIGLIGRDMEVSDCDIMSSDGAVNVNGRHIVIERNRLASASRHQEVEECVFADNTIRDTDMDNTGNCFEGKAYRLYIANNRIQDIYGWDREAITFDVPYGHVWMGQVAMSSPTVMTLSGNPTDSWGRKLKPDELKGLGVMIVSGKGLGQFIPITANDDKGITLAEPWVVEPDATSWVVIRTIKNQVALYNNQFEDAGKAIQLYANSYGFIIDGNSAKRAGGMYGRSRDYLRGGTRRSYSSCAFNQWINNSITQGTTIARDGITFGELGPGADFSTLTNPVTVSAMGNVVRNNSVSGDVRVGMGSDRGVNPRASLTRGRDTVIEGNRISDTPGSGTNTSGGAIEGIVLSGLFTDTVVRNNQVAPCPLPLRDDGLNTWIHPAEHLGYQIQSVRAVLGDLAELKSIQAECAALANKPVDETMKTTSDALRQKLWALVAAKSPQIPADLMASLTGLHFEIKPAADLLDAMRRGKGGTTSLTVQVRSEPWSPALTVQASLVGPGNQAVSTTTAPVSVPVNTPESLRCDASIPGGGISSLDVLLTVSLGNVPLVIKQPLEFNRLDLKSWLVSGSPNGAGWQPHAFPSRDADLGELTGTNSGTIYMASGVEASEPVSVQLDIDCNGGEAEFYLNDKPVASLSPQLFGQTGKAQKAKLIRLQLDKGPNLLLSKVTPQGIPSAPKSFTLHASIITDPAGKDAAAIREMSPDKVQLLPALQVGNAAAAGAFVRVLDNFENGLAEGWKFSAGDSPNDQVVESGEPARGKVLKRAIQYQWDHAPAVLYREITAGTLEAESQLGIRVWLKTEEPVYVELGLGSSNPQYLATLNVGTEWQEYRVPFDQFVKPGPGGGPITNDALKKITRISIMPKNDSSLSRSVLYIDDLSTLEKQPAATK